MHPWLQNCINLCSKEHADFLAFDQDPYANSIDLRRHYFGQFSMATVQANTLMEDQSQVEVFSKGALFFGIYDGHGGYHASQFISHNLFNSLLRIARDNDNTITESTLRDAVSATEEGFLDHVKNNYVHDPILGKVGSCCLVGVLWNEMLYIANLGDSRAVVGTVVADKLQVTQLTRDHNCNDRIIREELKSLHHDDPQIVIEKNGSWRVKGLIVVSRSIGDTYLKRPQFSLAPSFPKFDEVPEPFVRGVLSSEPEMHRRVIRDNDKFLVFASDGLWDMLTNEQVAHIVHTNPRNGIAKRLLVAAMTEAGRRREITYRELMTLNPGRDILSRRSFHDDLSVIVVFLDKPSFLRRHVEDMSFKGSSNIPLPIDIAQSRLSSPKRHPLSPKGLKASFQQLFKSNTSQASSSQSQSQSQAPQTSQTPSIPHEGDNPHAPLVEGDNPHAPLAETFEVESSQNRSLLGQSSKPKSRWENLRQQFPRF